MRTAIFVAVVCLLIVLGGQIYCLVTLDEEKAGAAERAGSISGRLECGELAGRCCAQGPLVLLNVPAEGAARGEEGITHGSQAVPCGGFFHFDAVRPGTHTLYIQYQITGAPGTQYCGEAATVRVSPGQHTSAGTLRLAEGDSVRTSGTAHTN